MRMCADASCAHIVTVAIARKSRFMESSGHILLPPANLTRTYIFRFTPGPKQHIRVYSRFQHMWVIEKIEISGGFLPGLNINVPRGLTCIIGARGSGKS